MPSKKVITRTIILLSLVSLFTDMASEMLYPITPLYLKEIGFSTSLIGLLEGFAECIAGLGKGYFGTWSDNAGRRMPFVRWGYSLSAISKPMMALFTYPGWIFFSRTVDRTGKGLRTGARDAMLSSEASKEHIGKVFGFHRALDTFGAVFGPLIALFYLYFYPGEYTKLFLWAFIPGVAAIIITLIIKEKKTIVTSEKKYPSFKSFYNYWINASPKYKKITGALLLFALFNSSDVFLLLRIKETGIQDVALISMYIIYNCVYALCAYPIGAFADRIGFKKMLVSGILIFSIVYGSLALSNNFLINTFLLLLYGVYAAATESTAKAWISNSVEKKDTGAAIGTFTGFQSIALFFASTTTGIVWYKFGSSVALLSSAAVAFFVALFIFYKTEE